MRNKDKWQVNLLRKVRHIPYGSQVNTGYGGELYIKKTPYGCADCICGGLINKRKARVASKKEIQAQLNEI